VPIATRQKANTGVSDSPIGEFRDKRELRQLTGRAQVNAQTDWLRANGLPHRRDGSRLVVSRYHVRQWIQGEESVRSVEPDISRVL
jgi:hypothetical protein